MVIGACLAIAMVVLNLPVGLVGSAGTVLGLRARLLLSGVVMLVAVAVTFTTPAPLAGAGMAAAVLLHAALLYRQLRLMRAEPGIALLVLRVFNHDTATGFTFNGLLQFWRHFGLHFTVVDTALVRVVSQPKLGWTRGAILAIVLIVMGFSAVLFIAADSADGAGNFPVAKLVLAAAAALVQAAVAALVVWAVIAFARQRVRRRFVRSMAQLQARVDNLTHRPRHPDMSFRHERALCPSDIWFMAVGNFARAAQVVLMDLRGYSSARKGCQKEVDFLFDTVPAERIVFLLDLHSDRDAVQQMLLARWAMQRADSPNLHAAAPVLQIYLAQAADNRDMQGVLDLLITAADRPVPARHGTPGPE